MFFPINKHEFSSKKGDILKKIDKTALTTQATSSEREGDKKSRPNSQEPLPS